jgi:hypothetical protein
MQQWRVCAATIIKAPARELDPLALISIQLREGKQGWTQSQQPHSVKLILLQKFN